VFTARLIDAIDNIAGSGTSVGDGNTQLQADGETDTFDAAGHVLTGQEKGTQSAGAAQPLR
jgi:hypothetical protein